MSNLLDGTNPKQAALSLAFGEAIQRFTLISPMTAEDVIAVLCFTAGSAMGQVAAHSKHDARQLRAMGVNMVDAGLDSARAGTGAKIILPH